MPVLVHAPSRRNFKGTEVFLAVLDRLREDGVAFDLRLLENVPNREVVQALGEADVVLDELNAPHYGMLALEGMATGCIVVAGCDRGYVPLQGESPIYAVRGENLYERLKLLLTDRDRRLRHARRGREFVASHHDHVKVAANMLSSLDGEGSVPDYYPTFFAAEYTLPEGELVAESTAGMTSQIVQQWGLPEEVRPESLVQRGLSSEVDPTYPIVNWRPVYTNVRKEKWGFSNRYRDARAPETEVIPGRIVELAQQALAALLRGDHQAAGECLHGCTSLVEKYPDALADLNANVAIGRLAYGLGESELAAAFYAQALELAPTRSDLSTVLKLLKDSLPSAA